MRIHAPVAEATRRRAPLLSCLAALLVSGPALAQSSTGDRPAYRSPIDVAYSPDGALLAVADRTWPGLVLINPVDGSVVREVRLLGDPYHVAWSGAGKVLVAEGSSGAVAEIDAASGTVLRRIPVGVVAKGLAVTPDGRLLVCDRARNQLVVLKLATGAVEAAIDVGREPGTVAVTSDGKYAVVGNKLPRASNRLASVPAAEVSLVTLATREVRAVALAKGTTMIRQVVLSPDGRWAYVTHQSPRGIGGLPLTQLDNGWVMASALSIIDVAAGTLYANFIFDRSGAGAAQPWGVAVHGDGSKLWVTMAGVREVASVDLAALHQRLAGYTQAQRADLLINLTDLHADGTIKRIPLTGVEGTRGIALSPDGKTLAVAAYFSGKVLLLSAGDVSLVKAVALPNNPTEDKIRAGERYYYSALNCYQSWLSCSSCHDEGRTDTLNWDLQNDGTGNPKQTKSHLFSSETPPTTITGCRENALVSTRASYSYIEFQYPEEERVLATYAFIATLAPEPSPYLGPDGQLTPEAVEGKKLFEGPAGCSGCHTGQYFTDMQKHDVGTRRSGTEGPDNNPSWDSAGYDTPTLIEVWRTAPYLHLGTAVTVKDVMTTENKNQSTHGNVAGLSPQQIDQLAAYVMQIGPTRPAALPQPSGLDAGTANDAPSIAVVPDTGVPLSDGPSAPVVPDAAVAPVATGGAGSGGAFGGTGGTGGTSGLGPSDASTEPGRRDGGAADARVKATIERGGLSCRLGTTPSSPLGPVPLVIGLAWLALRARSRRRGE